MEFSKNTIVQITVLACIVVFALVYLCKKTSVTEGFQTSPSIATDAENTDLTADQIFGLVPASASASIFKKKDARDKTANIDSLPFDKMEGRYYIETFNVEVGPDPSDIQEILITKLPAGYQPGTGVAADAAVAQLQGAVQEKVQEKLLKTKVGEKLTDKVVKALVKTNAKLSQKLGNRLGSGVAKKLAERAAIKIGELVGKRAAVATSVGATQLAIPDPTGFSAVAGGILTAFGVIGLAAQVVITTVLKGEDGFCPTGYERLNGAIPSFLTKIPGIGDILDVMGAYVCFRNSCEANEEEDAGLCYNKCDSGYRGVGPVCWANSNDVGVGQLKSCPPGWTNDGLTCRQPISCKPIYWDGCCSRTWPGICWGCARGGSCSGGTVKGRAAGSDLPCPTTHPNQIAGLCYKNCPSDTPYRVAGMPYLCSRASRVGDGRPDGTSYGRGVGKPKLKLKEVQKDPAAAASSPPPNSSASFADDPNTTCKADFSSTSMLLNMCKFYYTSSARVPGTVSNGIQFAYISKISKVVASSEQSCDVLCDITTITLPNATSKTPSASTTVKDKTRRFYFAKLVKACTFIVTAATIKDNTGKELSFPDAAPVSVNYLYNPLV